MKRAFAFIALLLLATSAQALDYSGKYTSAQITLELKADGTGYTGTMTIAGKVYPVVASEQGGKLAGTFEANGAKFPFSASIEGESMKLVSNNREYVLAAPKKPEAPAPANPLDQPNNNPPANPLDQTQNQPSVQSADPVAPQQAPKPPAKMESDQAVIDKLKSLPKGPDDSNREWTVLVHLNADNDLEKFGVQDLNEMEKGLSGTSVQILVLIDRCKGFDDSEGDWTGTRLYRVKPDQNMNKVASDMLLDVGEANMGDPKVLSAFVEGCLKAYPARQTALLMWNHGGGWASMSNDHDSPGNSAGHDDIKLAELREALETALPAANLKKLNLIGFDMCLMSQIETATELSDVAEVMVASQALEPGLGWPYDVVVPAFVKGTAGSRRIGTDIVNAFNDFYKTVKKEEVATLSALDLSMVGEFNAKLEAVLAKYEPTMQKNWPTLARAIFYGEQYCDRTDYRRGQQALATFDVLDIVKRLKLGSEGFPAEAEYRDFMAAADRFILVSANSERHKLSNGIAIYAPVRADMVNSEYMNLKFAKGSSWPKIIAALHAGQQSDTSVPKIENVRLTDLDGKPLAAAKPLAGHRYALTLTGNNVIYTHVLTGQRNPQVGGLVIDNKGFVIDPEWILRAGNEQAAHGIDIIMPKFKDGVNELKDELLGLGLVVTNGKETSTCTLDGTDLDQSDLWGAQVLLEHPQLGKDPVRGRVFFDNSFFRAKGVVAFVPQPDGTVRPRALEPAPDLKVYPLHEVLTDNGEVKLHCFKPLMWNNGLDLVLVTMPPGEYEAVLIAETMSGKTGAASAKFKMEADPELEQATKTWQYFRDDMMPGTWEVGIRFPDQIKPLWKIIMKPTEQPDVYLAEVTEVESGKQHKMLTLFDRKGLPNFRMIELLEGGKFGSTILGPVLFDMTKEGNPLLHMKMVNLSGINVVWRRVETTTVSGVAGENEERFKPVDTPDPQPLRPMQNNNMNNGGW